MYTTDVHATALPMRVESLTPVAQGAWQRGPVFPLAIQHDAVAPWWLSFLGTLLSVNVW